MYNFYKGLIETKLVYNNVIPLFSITTWTWRRNAHAQWVVYKTLICPHDLDVCCQIWAAQLARTVEFRWRILHLLTDYEIASICETWARKKNGDGWTVGVVLSNINAYSSVRNQHYVVSIFHSDCLYCFIILWVFVISIYYC